MKKAEVKPHDESSHAVETLEQIADEWFEQQRSRFENATAAIHKKQVSSSFSVFYIWKLFISTMFKKRRLDDILYGLRLCMPKITKFLKKKTRNAFVRLIEFILRIEKH